MHISTQSTQGQALKAASRALDAQKAFTGAASEAARLHARSKKINLTLISSHIVVVLVIVGILFAGYRSPVEASDSQQAARSVLEQQTNSVDQIAAANVASAVAQTVNLAVETNVQNLAVSLNAKTELAQTDTTYIAKPQIVQQETGRKGVSVHTVKDGDTVQSLAAAYGVSEDTIRWANNLANDRLRAGMQLKIPAVTGVIYTVKAGDDVAKLAEKYKADKDRILLKNDIELAGLQPGQQIIIPDGVLPDTERPGYRAPTSRYAVGAINIIGRGGIGVGGNGYARGYCTFYAFDRRAKIGRPIGGNWGNAATWASYARAAGFTVNHTPAVGAVMQNAGGWGGMGHVAVVEQVFADKIVVSEMNYRGWDVISTREVAMSQAGSYNFIH